MPPLLHQLLINEKKKKVTSKFIIVMIYNHISKFGGYTYQKPVFMTTLFNLCIKICIFGVIFILKVSPLINAPF